MYAVMILEVRILLLAIYFDGM